MDQQLPKEQRAWLRCDIDENADDVLVVLATKDMLETAVRRGCGEPIYMDATHGLQKYGLKIVTVHVKDEESQGVPSILRPEYRTHVCMIVGGSFLLTERSQLNFKPRFAQFSRTSLATARGAARSFQGYRIQYETFILTQG